MKRARVLASAVCVLLLAEHAQAQNFFGLKVGGSSNTVARFSGPVSLGSNGPDRFAKFRMPDGHDLSVTTRNFGPIIYLENNRNPAISPSVGEGLRFGATTRSDLLSLLGNRGFTYANRDRLSFNGGITVFHSYELSNQPGVVATFAFHLTPDRFVLGEDAALLDGIIVAQAWYLDEIWGSSKTASPGYTPVSLSY